MKNGMLYFYNKKNDILNPIILSQSAQITTAVWSETDNICTGGVNTELNYEPKI